MMRCKMRHSGLSYFGFVFGMTENRKARVTKAIHKLIAAKKKADEAAAFAAKKEADRLAAKEPKVKARGGGGGGGSSSSNSANVSLLIFTSSFLITYLFTLLHF